MENFSFFNAVHSHEFAEDICFLCGTRVFERKISKEHVFPKWLLNHFSLWNSNFIFLNGTKNPYQKLTIPCCNKCNNEYLSKVENEVRKNFQNGAVALKTMDQKILMFWILKIFFGILYRQRFLPIDQDIRNSNQNKIISPEKMERYRLVHYFLQGIRVPIFFSQVEGEVPASIFVFELQEPSDLAAQFDCKYNLDESILYLKMGKVGILFAFDMAAQAIEGASFFSKFQDKRLHPIQFAELGAKFFMKALKFNRVPKVIFSESSKGIKIVISPIARVSMRPVFDKPSKSEMAEMLMFFLGYPRDAVISIDNRLQTWLQNDDGSFRYIEYKN